MTWNVKSIEYNDQPKYHNIRIANNILYFCRWFLYHWSSRTDYPMMLGLKLDQGQEELGLDILLQNQPGICYLEREIK